jgi:hypothetical protein
MAYSALWFWEEGHADVEALRTSQRDTEAWTDDLDYMLRMNVRRRQFDWAAVQGDMQQYVHCIQTAGVMDSPNPPDVSVAALRKRWAYVDSTTCDFYRRKLTQRKPLAPAKKKQHNKIHIAPDAAPAVASKPPAVGTGAAPALATAAAQPRGELPGIAMERVLDDLDLDGLLEQLEGRQS